MKGITINKGSSEIVINLDKLKYTSTSSVNFGRVMLHGLSSEDITSIENALESAEKHSAAIEVGDRTINLDSITHLDADTIYYSDGPHISSVTPSDMEAIEDALEAYSPGPGPVPPTPSNLKFDPLHWTDVTSEWTLPAGLSDFSTLTNLGYFMWTDNQGNYYYERASSYPVYKIDFENKSITEMTGWTGRASSLFWRIGDVVMYSSSNIWNSDNTLSEFMWLGEYPSSPSNTVWTDGEDMYFTENRATYRLASFDPVSRMGQWEQINVAWTPAGFSPLYVWTDGVRTYYSRGEYDQYVWNRTNRDWETSVIDFQGYTLSEPTLQLFTDGVDIYMNSRGSAGSDNVLLKYNKAMWTFDVVSYPFEYKGPANMISKFMVCPSCKYRGLPSAIGNINPNTDDIYNRVSNTKVVVMNKIEVE